MAKASADEIARLLARKQAYETAELAVLRNQSYKMPDGRELSRANLSEIRKGLKGAEADYRCALGESTARGRSRRAWNMSR